MKQKQLISRINTIQPCPADFLTSDYGRKPVEGLLSKGFLFIDEHGYVRLTDKAYQIQVRFS